MPERSIKTQPVLLTFDDAAMEQHYKRHRNRLLKRTLDIKLGIVHLVMNAIFNINVTRGPSVPGRWLAAAYIGSVFTQVLSLLLVPEDLFVRHRNFVVSGWRCVNTVILAKGMPYWISSWLPAVTTGLTIKHISFGAGIVGQLWLTLSYPTTFRSLILTSLFGTVVYAHQLTGPTCSAVMAGDAGVRNMRAVWNTLNLATKVTFQKYLLPVPAQQEVQHSDYAVCLTTVTYLQMVFGLILPCFVMYTLECRSRQFFADTYARNANLRTWPEQVGWRPAHVGVVLVYGLLWLTVLWEVLQILIVYFVE